MELPVQLQSGEKVILLQRRHPVYVILQTIGVVIVAIIALVLWQVFETGTSEFLATIFQILFIAALVIGVVSVLVLWYRYRNDVWLITNKRLVDYSRPTPFSSSISSASLLNVQDISVEKRGILASIFDFGDVRCQTASASGDMFVFSGVPEPQRLMEIIDESRDGAHQAATSQTPQ